MEYTETVGVVLLDFEFEGDFAGVGSGDLELLFNRVM